MFACGLTSSAPRATVWTPDEASLTKASRGRDEDFRQLAKKSSEAFQWRQSPGARRSAPRAAAPDARMAKFFSGVFNYVFNELLVDTLANSRAFQRFAVRTDKALREAQASGKLTDVAKALARRRRPRRSTGGRCGTSSRGRRRRWSGTRSKRLEGASDEVTEISSPPRPPQRNFVRSANTFISGPTSESRIIKLIERVY